MQKRRWWIGAIAVLIIGVPSAAEATDSTPSAPVVNLPADAGTVAGRVSTGLHTLTGGLTGGGATSAGASRTASGATHGGHPAVSRSARASSAASRLAANGRALAHPATAAGVGATQSVVVVPAPAGSAEAFALMVGNILAISHTKASASSTGTSSTANAVELFGTPPLTQMGGTQTGPGTSSGALLDTGPSTVLRLQVTPWSATNTQASGQNTASAAAAILVLTVGDPSTANSASLQILPSSSYAAWNAATSSSQATSDLAILNVGGASGLTIDLLHADTSSTGTGTSYLIGLNGNQIGTSSQVNGGCTITVPGVISLNCLTASSGAGAVQTAAAGIASATLGTGGPTAGLIQAQGSRGSGAAPTVSAGGSSNEASAPASLPSVVGPAAPHRHAALHALARTGFHLPGLVALALLLLVGGAGIVMVSRRQASPVA